MRFDSADSPVFAVSICTCVLEPSTKDKHRHVMRFDSTDSPVFAVSICTCVLEASTKEDKHRHVMRFDSADMVAHTNAAVSICTFVLVKQARLY